MSLKKWMHKYSPTILTCIGSAGVIFTAVLAVKATPKALKLIEEKKSEMEVDELTPTEIIQCTWQCYIPTAIACFGTISCIFGANVLNQKNQACLMSAYSLLEKSFKEYREHAVKVYGEDADKKIRDSIVQDKYSGNKFILSDGKQLFFDFQGAGYFESTLADVQRAEYELNALYDKFGYVCLNDFYSLIGLPEIEGCSYLGWSMDASASMYGYSKIEFVHEVVTLDDGLNCHMIIMPYPPTNDFLC